MGAAKRLLIPSNEGKSVANNFDLIRIAMALLVVWSHSFALLLGSEDSEPLSVLTGGIINSGNLAVLVFFIVSGFLITQSFDRSSSAASYMQKRVLRIHPGYLVATSICAFVILPIYANVDYDAGEVFRTLGLNALLRGYFVNPQPFTDNPNGALNGALWSIPFEFWCYIGVLVAGSLGMIRRARYLLVALTALMILTRVFLLATGKRPGGGLIELIFGWQYTWFTVGPFFLSGMLAYLYRQQLPRQLWIAVAGPLVVIAACHLPIALPLRQGIGNALLVPAAAYSVMYFGFGKPLANAARYGDFSYGTYLYAFPIQQMLVEAFRDSLTLPLFIVLSMGLALLAGALSWHGVERWFQPSRRGVGKHSSRDRPPAAPPRVQPAS